MSILAISGNSNTVYSPMQDASDIRILEKQKTQLMEQLQKVSESKLDDKSKQERIKQLQEQIQQIELQIQQKQSEKYRQKNEQAVSKERGTPTHSASISHVSDSADISKLVEASGTYNQAKIMSNTRERIHGNGNVLKMEIKLDEQRGVDPKRKKKELHQIESTEENISKKLGQTIEASQDQIYERQELKDNTERKETEAVISDEKNKPGDKESRQALKKVDVRI